jgi:phosphopantothenoylcysteine decarboxylase/phosphopantothenate--cysteine ligase
MTAKHLDLICANEVGRPGTGFDADDNELLLLWPRGRRVLARADKHRLAQAVIEQIAQLRVARTPQRKKGRT